MADTETTASTSAETAAGPSVAELDGRVSRIETAVTTLIEKLHGTSAGVTEERLDAPGDVAAEVQRELARRDAKVQEDERAAKLGRLEETVTKLTEKKPAAPLRRIEQWMGWHS